MYSHKDFTGKKLIGHTIEPQVIRGSCFSQEEPDTEAFPSDMTGVTFINCNLDNCTIPEGNTVIDCSTRRFKVQNDLNDWEIDENDNPVRVVNWLTFSKNGLPQPQPADIPLEKVDKRIDLELTAREA